MTFQDLTEEGPLHEGEYIIWIFILMVASHVNYLCRIEEGKRSVIITRRTDDTEVVEMVCEDEMKSERNDLVSHLSIHLTQL